MGIRTEPWPLRISHGIAQYVSSLRAAFTGRQGNYLSLIFIIAVALRILSFLVSGDESGDGACRALIGLGWMKNPSLLPSRIWLPLHFYLIGGALKIWNDPVNTPRLLSLVFGILSFFPFYGLVRIEFGKKMALISTLFFAIYPFHIRFSVVSLAEVPFLFFLLCSLYFFLLYWREKSTASNLIFSAFALNLACMIRLEGWFFIPILSLALLYRRSFRSGIQFFVLASILPAAYVVVCKVNLGVWIPYLQLVKPEKAYPKWTLIALFKLIWPVSLSLTPMVVLLCGIGLLKSMIRKSHLLFAVFIGTLLIPLAKAATWYSPRYFLFLTVLLLPFFILGYSSVKEVFPIHRRTLFPVIAAIVILSFAVPLISFSIFKNKGYSPFVITPQYVCQISKWLKDNVKEGDRFILDEDRDWWWSLNIILMAELTDWKDIEEMTNEMILMTQNWEHTPTHEEISRFITNNQPRYLMYSPRGEFPQDFSSVKDGDILVWKGHSFKRIPYSGDRYRIFEINTKK